MLLDEERTLPHQFVASDADALIREARRRTRRRRGRIAAIVLAVGVGAVYLAAGGGNGGASRPHNGSAGRPASAAAQASSPQTTVAFLRTATPQEFDFVSPRLGYAIYTVQRSGNVSAFLLKTTDGGANFTSPLRVPSYGPLTFDSRGDGFIYAGPMLVVTHDGGRNWSVKNEPYTILGVSLVGRSVWLLVSGCLASGSVTGDCGMHLLTSANGGRSWSRARNPFGDNVGLGVSVDNASGQLVRVGASKGYVVAQAAVSRRPFHYTDLFGKYRLVYTANDGASWSQRRLDCPPPTPGMTAAAASQATLVAICSGEASAGAERKSVAFSSDTGRRWRWGSVDVASGPLFSSYTTYVSRAGLPELNVLSANTAFLFGWRGRPLVTHDGGARWAFSGPFNDGGGGPPWLTFFNAKQGVAYAAANAGPDDIWHTANGGKTWTGAVLRIS
jgi:hypothetical protein